MDYEPVVSHNNIDNQNFWKAVNIWLQNPHVINRRILSIKKLFFVRTNSEIESGCTSMWIQRLENIVEIHRNHSTVNETDSLQALKLDVSCDTSASFQLDDSLENGSYVCLHKLFPRNPEKFSQTLELVFIDKLNGKIIFFSDFIDKSKQTLSLKWPYKLEYNLECCTVTLYVHSEHRFNTDPSITWLREQFFPRFVKWMNEEKSNNGLTSGSLKLICVEKYAILYNELKKKYGTELVKIWSENTDPTKFVYEDIAIATYLLLLWEIERGLKNEERKQSFVDLGCGNGLLVHILASEGHPGLGIDLRKRKIWDLYPESTHLEVRTIIPSASSLFPDTDWLIGNHSDELTPWIPVIAARSSYQCRFFLLPCCAYEFDGRKYQRDSAAKSQYFEYMNYIKKVCEECGFKTDVDKLRIPSTKRICLIGWERTYPKENKNVQEVIIQRLINARSANGNNKTKNSPSVPNDNLWSVDFKPREPIERVRNCTKVDKNLISDVVNLVAEHLLRKVRMIDVPTSKEKWNAGGQIELSEIAKLLSQDTLKGMKSECGGLQTLLKNNGDIFQIVEGKVQFKVPGNSENLIRRKKKNNSKLSIKSKSCWFYLNHPNGCPLNVETCNFKH